MLQFSKRSLGLMAAIAALLYAPQTSANFPVVGTASATVTDSLSVTQITPLSFGSFSANSQAGTVTSDGVDDGGVTYFSGATHGEFSINGAPGVTVRTLSAATTVELSNGSETMLANITIPSTAMLDSNGDGTLQVTGTLNVAAAQAPGNYTGSYNFTVDYL